MRPAARRPLAYLLVLSLQRSDSRNPQLRLPACTSSRCYMLTYHRTNLANPGPDAAIRGLLDTENNARISLDVGLLGCRAVLIRCGSRHRRFFPALLIVFRSQHAMRRSTCFDLYKLWSASLRTDARHRAWKKLEEMSRDRCLLKEYSEDNDFIYDFSQIEHFFVDLHSLIRESMICPKLAPNPLRKRGHNKFRTGLSAVCLLIAESTRGPGAGPSPGSMAQCQKAAHALPRVAIVAGLRRTAAR
jgi:hypothetical protein